MKALLLEFLKRKRFLGNSLPIAGSGKTDNRISQGGAQGSPAALPFNKSHWPLLYVHSGGSRGTKSLENKEVAFKAQLTHRGINLHH